MRRPRVTQWIMCCATERKWQRSDSEASSTFSCRERPCDALSSRRSHARKLKGGVGTLAMAAWSLISVSLGRKGRLVALSITFERRHTAALKKVGPGDSSNSGDSASISIDAAVSLKLSKVFSALAHFSTIGPRETLLLNRRHTQTHSAVVVNEKLKHCRSGGWALFWVGMSEGEKNQRNMEKLSPNPMVRYNCLTDRQKHTQKRKELKIKRQQCCESPAVEVCTFMRMCVPGRVSWKLSWTTLIDDPNHLSY